MSIFALKRIDAFECLQSVDKLVIDDICQFDEFEISILKDNKYKNEIGMIYRYIEYVSNGLSLPANHFKEITPDKEKVKE